MPIYTKTGDNGTTALFGGQRVSKHDVQVSTYGTVDELSCFIGLLMLKKLTPADKQLLIQIQKDLYQVMAFLSGASIKLRSLQTNTDKIEKRIDLLERKLPSLTRFILPQGSEAAVFFHIVRAVCRRAERKVVKYMNNNEVQKDLSVIQYLNRLSDLFFILARYYNQEKEIGV